MKKEVIRSYEPDNVLKNGFFKIFREIYLEIKDNKWLIFQLFKRDLLAVYKQSFFGIFWAVFFPLISVGTFVLLNNSGIFRFTGDSVPYPIFAISGMAFWQLFSSGIIASSNSLIKAGSMIIRINFSKKSLVIASMGQSLISFLVQFILTILLFIYFGYSPHWSIVLTPLYLLPVLFLTLGLGLLFSILNGIARDTGNIISVFITFFLFLTPVLYNKPETGFLSTFSGFNPMYYLISYPRDMILKGYSDHLPGFLISSLISLFLFVFFLFFFHLSESRVTERI